MNGRRAVATGLAMIGCVALAGSVSADQPAEPSPALQKILDAKGASGQPVITPEARAYFDALPERARVLIDHAVADEVITSAQHLGTILAVQMPTATFEFAMGDRCFLCHSDPEVQTGDTLFSPDPAAAGLPAHMALAMVVQDTHFRQGLSCAGCHGGDPTDPMGHDFVKEWPTSARSRQENRSWIPDFCGRCHSDSAFMRRFAPTLPTDQLEKYRLSRHGLVLAAGDSRAAQCVSCHGVHGILGAKNPGSRVYPTHVPDTCGACHGDAKYMAGFRLPDGSPLPTDQVEKYRQSVHGQALLERGDLGAPTCNDCHGNHAAMPPEVASVAQICRTCHARNGELFDGSKHKQAFEAHGWAECDVCHGKHAIERTSDAMLAPGPDALCTTCHAKYATHNPSCRATATYFYDSLEQLTKNQKTFTLRAERLARRGLDVDTIDGELATLSDSIKQARSYVHAFDRSEFDRVADQGRVSVLHVVELETTAQDELAYRRLGLLLAVGLLALLMLLLYLKLGRMESPDRRD